MPIIAPCALCLETSPLLESHILPAFVYKWLKDRSITGHIRFSETPNRRTQDGLKKPWLCSNCEGRFSRYETHFANKLFHPWLKGQQHVYYDDWLLKFCVSVSWRVLKYCKGLNPNHVYSQEQESLAQHAESTWRAFLLGQTPHPSSFEQHLLIFDTIEETSVPDFPNNINRFLMGAVTMDIVGSSRSMMTYAKLGRFTIFGIIQKGKDKWEGSKIHVKHGLIKPGRLVLPFGLIELFKEKATHTKEAYESISDLQHEKIDAAALENIDRAIGSDQLASMIADANMFGEHAILRKSKKPV